MSGEAHPCGELAAYLTGTEAKSIADVLSERGPLSQALSCIGRARRQRASALLRAAGIGTAALEPSLAVLRAIEGASSRPSDVLPVWTAPGSLGGHGALTSSVHHLIASARESITCSTYNFQKSSSLWAALGEASQKEHLRVRLYVDTAAADGKPASWKPTTQQVAQSMPGARVLRTRVLQNRLVRSHAKFVAIDHQFIIVGSANFSVSAEQHNIELGLRIDDPPLVERIEHQMEALEPHCYEMVEP